MKGLTNAEPYKPIWVVMVAMNAEDGKGGRGTTKQLPRPSPKPRTPGGGHGRMGKWTRNREAVTTTLTKATDSRRRPRPDGQVDEEPRSSYHDPHQSHGLQEEATAERASGRRTAKRLPRPSPKPRTPGGCHGRHQVRVQVLTHVGHSRTAHNYLVGRHTLTHRRQIMCE